MPNANAKSRAVTVRLPHDIINAVDAEAEDLDKSRSWIVSLRLRKSFSRVPAGSFSNRNSSKTDDGDAIDGGLTLYESEDDEE